MDVRNTAAELREVERHIEIATSAVVRQRSVQLTFLFVPNAERVRTWACNAEPTRGGIGTEPKEANGALPAG